jgi:hypothetical protein
MVAAEMLANIAMMLNAKIMRHFDCLMSGVASINGVPDRLKLKAMY